MNELTIKNNELIPAVSNQLAYIENQIAELTALRDELRNRIKEEMEAKGIIKLENDELLINYIQPTYRETFDTKKFRAEHEDLYNAYIRTTNIAASLRVKVK